MKLDSVRELKQRFFTQMAPPGSIAALGAYESSPVRPRGRTRSAAQSVMRGISVGVAVKVGPTRKSFRLAVRVRRRSYLEAPQVRELLEAAGDEADVRVVGNIVALARKARTRAVEWYRGECRPLRIGCSLGHFSTTAGTLGCFVRPRGQTSGVWILSNNHVLALENQAAVGEEILQPGRIDGGRRPGARVATLDSFVPLILNAPSLVDAAIARVDTALEQVELASLKGEGTLAGLGPELIDQGTLVSKIGRTSGVTRGRISAFELDNVEVRYGIGMVRFDNQIEIRSTTRRPFSQGGDSGSLVYTTKDRAAIALLFAGNDDGLTYATPLRVALDALNVDLLL